MTTLHPTPPDCDVWPKCGCDVTGRPCSRAGGMAPTLPAPPADAVPALVALAVEVRVKAARLRSGEAALSPTDAARYRRLVAVELDRLAGERTDGRRSA